jgi:hypothetical protein
MDTAYDHIQQETIQSKDDDVPNNEAGDTPSLNTEFQEAWGAVSSSPWAARLGGLWGTVKKTVCVWLCPF